MPRSVDSVAVMVPPRSPVVTETLRVPPTVPATKHLTDVSDSHSVPSHTLRPTAENPENAVSPMLRPCTVTLADPVLPTLTRRVALRPIESDDQLAVTLPARSPTVIATRRVPRTPSTTRHLTDVSDSQAVPSHPVCPTWAIPEYAFCPRHPPSTVTLVDPVPARFLPATTLTAMSTDQLAVTLPACSPTVITTLLVPLIPSPSLHRTDVSDSHAVPSQMLYLTPTRNVYPCAPMPAPCTVRLADPVPPLLFPTTTLKVPVSTDQLAVRLPILPPTVTTTCRLPRIPFPNMHRTDVSDTQADSSHIECPNPRDEEYSCVPIPIPSSATLCCPLACWFTDLIPIVDTASYVTTSVAVADFVPTVATALMLPPDPAATKHHTELSVAHSVFSHPVLPTLTPVLCIAAPCFPTVTFMLPCPVVPWLTRSKLNTDTSSYCKSTRSVKVLTRIPAVTCIDKLRPLPSPALHNNELCETQLVAMHCESPKSAVKLRDAVPSSAPTTVRVPFPPPTFD
eukprot:2236131-Rhodomonas_salina.1